jgi:hypothetical protein
MRTRTRLVAVTAVLAAVVTGVALRAEPAAAGTSTPAASVQPAAAYCGNNGTDLRPSRDEVLRRARSWMNNTQNDSAYDPVNFYGDYVPYSQAVCHTNGYGSYRQDCSGFVAMAWGLGGAGDAWWTGNLRPAYSGGHTIAIGQTELAPGDALLLHVGNDTVDHVALFVRWIEGKGAVVYEQTPGRPRVSFWSMSQVNAYTPIRYALLANTLVSGGFGHLNLVDGSGGDTAWANGGAQNQIGSGWLGGSCNYQAIQSGGDGRIYVIDGAGQLRWWRHLDPTGGTASWATVSPCGNYIGNGWL